MSGYVPTLQVGGQVFTFLHDHRGMPAASPAVFGQISGRFRQAVDRFAQMNDIPVVKFKKGIRKLDVMQRYLRAAARAERPAWRRSAETTELGDRYADRGEETISSPSAESAIGSCSVADVEPPRSGQW
jgi:hypothetical protein